MVQTQISPRKLKVNASRFSQADIQKANHAWRCTCGPAAIACILDLTLDEVRPLLGDNYRGLMNPTEMLSSLTRAGVQVNEHNRNRLFRPDGPRQNGCPYVAHYGITRIQFEGPWTHPDEPPAKAYHYTHWVASTSSDDGFPSIYDINWGWMLFGDFLNNMEELALETPRATGRWWPTHIYEITFPV